MEEDVLRSLMFELREFNIQAASGGIEHQTILIDPPTRSCGRHWLRDHSCAKGSQSEKQSDVCQHKQV